jgi:hypothetical protein
MSGGLETDFEHPDSLADFGRLLQRAEAVAIIPPASSENEIRQKSPARNLQYALAGACIARHSDILLALWDGEEEAGVGGTAQIVRFHRSGRFEQKDLQQAFERLERPLGPEADPLAASSGLIVHVVTPHGKCPRPDQSFEVAGLAPILNSMEATDKLRNTFNQDLIRLWSATAKNRKNQRAELFPQDKAHQLPEALRTLREQQAGADALAIHFQRRTKATIFCVGALVLVAAIAFARHSTLAPPDASKIPWSLALYLLLIAAAAAVHALAKHLDFHSKFLDYRAVAEGLRVQFYWSLAGLKNSAADHYLRRQRGELGWIPHVLRSWDLPLAALCRLRRASASRPSNSLPEEPSRMVRELWLQGQAKYFRQRAPRDRRLLFILAAARNILLLANLAVATFEVLSAPQIFPKIRIVAKQLAPNLLDSTADAWKTAVMGLAAVAAALVYGYAETMALSDESKQYERMKRIFDSALQKPAGPDLLEALGKEALAENGEWVLMHRERPVEMPK